MVEEVILNQLSLESADRFFPAPKSSLNLNWIVVLCCLLLLAISLYMIMSDQKKKDHFGI